MTRSFGYLRPETIDEAVAQKAAHGSRARFWAGGTDLTLLWDRREVSLEHCIDLTFVPELRFYEVSGGDLRIGAMATLDDLDLGSDLNALAGTLGDTARLMCTKQTRTIATVGGNMCHASPSADLTPPLVAMGAVVKLRGPAGERSVPLEDFHVGVNETVLGDDEILTEIVVPDCETRTAASYRRVARTVVDIALVSSAASLRVDGNGCVEQARIALGAVAPHVLRVPDAEAILVGGTLDDAAGDLAERAGEHASRTARAITDIRASSAYRTDMTATLTRRAVRSCVDMLEGRLS